MYYKPIKVPAKVKPELAELIHVLIEAEPSFGHGTVVGLFGMKKNTL